jgi:trk system potassium uptake protein TrkH
MLYFMTFFAASLAVTALGADVPTAFFSVLSSLSNVGPALARLGPVENYAWLPSGVKWILGLCMLIGRLEIYPVLRLFLPSTWRH